MPDNTKDIAVLETAFIVLASALISTHVPRDGDQPLHACDVVKRAEDVADRLRERGHFAELVAYMGGKVPGIES
jgi:hypothetical protein